MNLIGQIRNGRNVRLVHLREHDLAHHASLVRELEMVADSAITATGYAVQFWTDVRIYGIDEAIMIVEDNKRGDASAIRAKWEEIKARLVESTHD